MVELIVIHSLDTHINEITVPERIKVSVLISNYSISKLTKEERVILKQEEMIVSRLQSKDYLEPKQLYIMIKRQIWRTTVKFLSSSKKERYQGGSYNMEEILLNKSLQKIAKERKEQGESMLFDLFTEFLKMASQHVHSDKKKKENQTKMCKIALQILACFLPSASAIELSKVTEEIKNIRSQPPRMPRPGGICMLSSWMIILWGGILAGIGLISSVLL